MRLIGRGDAAIRATHGKTLEFTPDAAITERATCIVAVGAQASGERVAGPVRITIRAGGQSFSLEALANPGWRPGGPAVVRRSERRRPGTLATEASAAADDLPRALVEALRDPAAAVEVLVEPLPGRPAVVLAALDAGAPPDPRVAAERAVADVVVAEDDLAAALIGGRVDPPPARLTGRVLVVATRALPGASVAGLLADGPVDVLGLPPALAAAAACPSRAPLLLSESGDARAVLRSAPAGHRVVVRVAADEVAGLLALAGELRAAGSGTLVAPEARPRRVTAGAVVAGRDLVHLCFDPAPESGALDPTVRAVIAGLLADGVATKTAANALAALTGWERRRAYDTVLGWRAT